MDTSCTALTPLYTKLMEDEIRLLTIKSLDEYTAHLELRTYTRAIAPAYDAISWTWGTDKSKTWVTCNGLPFAIRTTLFRLFPQTLAFQSEPRRPLWIDALCLHQNDAVEKAMHVPLMNDIYEEATQTLICLGEAQDDSDLAIDSIERFTKIMLTIDNSEDLSIAQKLAKYNLPTTHAPIWEAIKTLQLRPWFYRLWTMQEIVLSKQAFILCGWKSLSWEALVALHEASIKTGLINQVTSLAPEEAPYKKAQIVISHINFIQTSRSKAPGRITFPVLLLLSADRGYSLAVDRIWGLLGMVNKHYRRKVRDAGIINYNQSAIENYHETFLAIMKFHIDHDKFLALDMIEGNLRTIRNVNLPSWCPDWHTDAGGIPLSKMPEARAGFPGGVWRRISPFMKMNDDATLEICGIPVERVERTTTEPGRNLLDISSYSWVLECLDIVRSYNNKESNAPAEVQEGSEPKVVFWAGDVPMSDERRRYKRAEDQLKTILFPPGVLYKGSVPTILRASDRKFFCTSSGKFGIGPPDLKEGDLLVAMYGARTIFALRRVVGSPEVSADDDDDDDDDDDGTGRRRWGTAIEDQKFELLGTAYLPSLVNGQAFDGVSCEDMRRFRLV